MFEVFRAAATKPPYVLGFPRKSRRNKDMPNVLASTTNELRKGLNLAWYHHLTHITCVQNLRGLREKLDALRVQTGPSLSKYKGFTRKLICYKDISFF